MTTSTAPAPLGDLVRLADVEFFMSYPFDVFARMRAEAPVYWSEDDQTWALTKYEDIRQVSKSPHLFSNRFGQIVAAVPDPRRRPTRRRRSDRRVPDAPPRGGPGRDDRGPCRHPHRGRPTPAHVPPQARELGVHAEGDLVARTARRRPRGRADRPDRARRRDGLHRHGGGAGAHAGDRRDARRVDRPARRLPALVRRLHRAERPERRPRRGRDQPVLRRRSSSSTTTSPKSCRIA